LAIIERADGKPTQPTTLSGKDVWPVQVEAVTNDLVRSRPWPGRMLAALIFG
jgi:hypothetical protein